MQCCFRWFFKLSHRCREFYVFRPWWLEGVGKTCWLVQCLSQYQTMFAFAGNYKQERLDTEIHSHTFAFERFLVLSLFSCLTFAIWVLWSSTSSVAGKQIIHASAINDSKTEFFISASSHARYLLTNISLQIGGVIIHPSATVRNLGVQFNQHRKTSENHVLFSFYTSLVWYFR